MGSTEQKEVKLTEKNKQLKEGVQRYKVLCMGRGKRKDL